MEVGRPEVDSRDTQVGAIEPPAQNQTEKAKAWLREIIETMLLAVVIWLAVNLATARFVVEGASMEPTLHTGEFVIVSRLAYKLGEPQRGDIVVFEPPRNPNEDYIKRIIGLPGERVEIRDGRLYVNGAELQESYLDAPTIRSGVWSVNEGEYFVLGDNRNDSDDSRNWGALETGNIIGKAWVIYWPPRDWGTVPHETYAAAPSPVVPVALATATTASPLGTALGESVPPPGESSGPPVQDPPPATSGWTGSTVVVAGTEGVGLAVREGAGTDFAPLFVATDGQQFVVQGGPHEEDGYVWWYVVDPADPERVGWAAQDFLVQTAVTGWTVPAGRF